MKIIKATMQPHAKNIFLTGALHSGKSTIINQVLQRMTGWNIGGFRTRPVFESAQKCGFVLQSFDGLEECFAHTEMKSSAQFDIYHYDSRKFDDLGATILQRALTDSDLIVMDEIGMMEMQAKQFQQMICRCLDAPVRVLGAFQQRADWFRALLSDREDTMIVAVDPSNRIELVEWIISLLHSDPATIKFLT
ncbi:MAG: nucleoside-triphosphatase [candidate division KSB1 bacterium]|nr:nucleoside-triphosphatase [candidate division KSB1 bacterium]MDZ7318262.1 nucleoside-triphosphatase [candidate division KSB1 bacterium]MDZ7340146.1 nucleoside-triphosphatase [candidate division KSB1 bacterium]